MKAIKGFLFWSFINNMDSKYKQWRVTWVGDAKTAKILKDLGLKPKMVDPEEAPGMAECGTHFLKLTRKLEKRGKAKGKGLNKKPKCAIETKDGMDWYTGPIGNGSEGTIQFNVFEWSWNGKSGKGADLDGVIIHKLVEYVSESNDGDQEEAEDSLFKGLGDAPEDSTDYSKYLREEDSEGSDEDTDSSNEDDEEKW